MRGNQRAPVPRSAGNLRRPRLFQKADPMGGIRGGGGPSEGRLMGQTQNLTKEVATVY